MPLFGGPPDIWKLTSKRDIRGLGKALGYQKDAMIRLKAAQALGGIGGKEAVEPLIETMMDKEARVRIAVAEALGKIGDARAEEPLVAMLKEELSEVRLAALVALRSFNLDRVRPEAAVFLLVGTLTDKNGSVTSAAVNVLEKIDPARYWTRNQESRKAIPALLNLLISTPPFFNEDFHRRIMEILISIGQTGADPLIVLLLNKNPHVRSNAAKVLDKIDPNWAMSEAARRAVPMVVTALQEKDFELLADTIVVLKKIDPSLNWTGSEAAQRATPTLVAALENSTPDVQKLVSEVLIALRWQPGDDAQMALLLVARQDWEMAVRMGTSAIKPLIAALQYSYNNAGEYGDKAIGKAAGRALARIGGTQVVSALRLILHVSSYGEIVMKAAAEILGQIPITSAVEALISVIRDKSSHRQWDASQALVNLGEIAVEPLIATLADKKLYWSSRRLAAVALGQIGNPKAIKPLVSALQDQDKSIRQAAVEALVSVQGTGAFETLVEVLSNYAAVGRIEAAQGLEKLGDARAVKPLIACLTDQNPDIRRAAIRILKTIAPDWSRLEIAHNALQALFTTLQNTDEKMRQEIIGTLEKIGDPRAVEALIACLRDQSSDVRVRVVEALSQIGDPRAIEAFIACLTDQDKRLIYAAARALSQIGDPRAVEPLIACLTEQDERLVYAAAGTLGQIGDPRAVEALIACLTNRRDKGSWGRGTVEDEVAKALGQIGDPRAIEPLIACLPGSPEDEMRRQPAVVEVLGKIGDTRAVKPLIALIKPDRAHTAITTIAVLQHILEKYIQIVDTEDLQVIAALEHSLAFRPVEYWDGYELKRLERDHCTQICHFARQELIRRGVR